MISGRVSRNFDAVVRLRILGPTGQDTEVDAAIDTGFDGALTLTPDTIALLTLPLVDTQGVILGDGSITSLPVYLATVEWDGDLREVRAYASVSEELVGTALLQDHELRIRFRAGDDVTIIPF